jgi:hypothetical protein
MGVVLQSVLQRDDPTVEYLGRTTGHIILVVVIMSRNNQRADMFLIDPVQQDHHQGTLQEVLGNWLPDTVVERNLSTVHVPHQQDNANYAVHLIVHAVTLLYHGTYNTRQYDKDFPALMRALWHMVLLLTPPVFKELE